MDPTQAPTTDPTAIWIAAVGIVVMAILKILDLFGIKLPTVVTPEIKSPGK